MTVLMPGRLHVITDETVQSRLSHVELAAVAADGGADTVQFREKRDRPTAELTRMACAIRERLDGCTLLIVNDRVNVAAESQADGVHLGAGDPDPVQAREMLGDTALIGATANHLAQARSAARGPIDYLGVGPVFGTESKQNPAPTLGLDGLRRVVRSVDRPVIAIGNITTERVAAVFETGAYGVAVLSAVVGAHDPAREVSVFADAIEKALAARMGQ
jgi:thiamine-phosphate pyrophosphorylase